MRLQMRFILFILSFACTCLVLLFTSNTLAISRTDLYKTSELYKMKNIYSENILWNYHNTIWKVLNIEERQRLRNVSIMFPSISKFGDPMDYYTLFNPNTKKFTVHMPILSIKFFDDLAIAFSWLNENNYTVDTIWDYVLFLKYLKRSDFPGGDYQKPLPALYIPENVLMNKRVNSSAQKILKSALLWILLHELGHVYHQHGETSYLSYKMIQQQESDADAFATEVMRRIGVAPIGMGLFFSISVHWWVNRSDCPNLAAWNKYLQKAHHPPTPQRLRNVAALILEYSDDFSRKEYNKTSALYAIKNSAITINKLATILESDDLQRFIRKRAQTFGALPSPLKPRRYNELPAAPKSEYVKIPVLLNTACE